jgi:hypothetical protein
LGSARGARAGDRGLAIANFGKTESVSESIGRDDIELIYLFRAPIFASSLLNFSFFLLTFLNSFSLPTSDFPDAAGGEQPPRLRVTSTTDR